MNFNLDVEIANYEQAIALGSKDATIYKQLANAYAARGYITKSIIKFKEASVLDSNDSEIYKKLGNIYSSQGNNIQAIANFEKAIALDSNNITLLKAIGYEYFLNQEIDKSIRSFKAILDLQPNYSMIHTHLGFLHLRKGDYETAHKYNQQAWRLSNETDFYTAKNMAHLSLLKEDKDAAIQQYKAAIPLWENLEEYLRELKADYKDLKMEEKGISKEDYEAVLLALRW